MSDKRLALEHVIRNIAEGKFRPSDEPKITLEHAIRNVHEAVGSIGTDKFQGSQFKQARTVTPHISPDQHAQSAETVSKQRQNMKEKGSLTLHGKVSESAPNQGDAATVAQWPAAEGGKKKKVEKESMGTMGGQGNEVGDYGRNMKEDSEPYGTKERRKVSIVGRPNDPAPTSNKSTLNKHTQIVTKIIDEEKKKDKVKLQGGKTQVDFEPTIKMAAPENRVSEENVDEGIMDKVKNAGKVAGVVGALGAHAGKVYDVGAVATHQDPAHAVSTALTYANPASRALNMLPTAFKADKLNKGEDEKARQKKFGSKIITKESEMSDETNLIDSFLALQNDNTGNMFEAAKKLSAGQKKIAAMAGDKKKIEAADLAALRDSKKMEEEVEEVEEGKTDGSKMSDMDKHRHGYAQMYGRSPTQMKPNDKLSSKLWNRPASDMRTTKSGKIHGQDQKAKANEIKSRLGSHTKPGHLPEDIEFSAEELAYFDSVMEANPVAKEDSTAKGSFKKASGTTPNGDPVRPTIPTRDLTDSVEVEEGYASIGHPFTRFGDVNPKAKFYGNKPKPTKPQAEPGAGDTYKDSKQGGKVQFAKPAKEDVEFSEEELAHFADIQEGRPKKNPTPESSERDPRQHIQVVAGQAAAGRHIEFKHNDGSKTTITPQHGRKIVAHLNSLKPAERQDAVNKMHDSSKHMEW